MDWCSDLQPNGSKFGALAITNLPQKTAHHELFTGPFVIYETFLMQGQFLLGFRDGFIIFDIFLK